MKITKLSFSGYRGFVKKEISFSPQRNVIIGESGSGKTSLLNLIDCVFSEDFMENRFFTKEDVSGDEISVSGAYTEKEVEAVFSIETNSLNVNPDTDEIDHAKVAVNGAIVIINAGIIEGVYESILSGGLIENFLWHESIAPIQKEYLIEMLKGSIPFCDNVLIDRNDSIAGNEKIDLIFVLNGIKVPFHNLSKGMRKAVMTVMHIIIETANYKAKEPENMCEGSVMIDNFEDNLSLNLQSHLTDFLLEKFPNIQFIITTHSPIVTSFFKQENIIALENRYKKQVPFEAEAIS